MTLTPRADEGLEAQLQERVLSFEAEIERLHASLNNKDAAIESLRLQHAETKANLEAIIDDQLKQLAELNAVEEEELAAFRGKLVPGQVMLGTTGEVHRALTCLIGYHRLRGLYVEFTTAEGDEGALRHKGRKQG